MQHNRFGVASRFGVISLLVLITSAASAQGSADTPAKTLGTFPICEPSAARLVPCGAGSGGTRCVVVADNEISDKLFLFTIDKDGVLKDPKQLPLGLTSPEVKKIDDIEALEIGPDGVLVFGSHSRKSFKPEEAKHCQRDGGRLTFAQLQLQDGVLRGPAVKTDTQMWQKTLTAAGCSTRLIAIPSGERGQTLAQKACEAIADADTRAETDPAACSRAFNIEGVVSLPGFDGSAPRIWIGLRAPLVDGKAVLLRLHDLTHLEFDGIAMLAIEGFGVRDLAYARGSLWVLAGPMADELVPGSVWSVPASAVASGAELVGHRETSIGELPAFAEGLAIDELNGDAFIVVDGDAGKRSIASPVCTTAALQLLRHLPAAAAPTEAPMPVAPHPSAFDPATPSK